MAADLSAKRLELLRLLVPSINGFAVLWDSSNPGMALRVRETRQAAEQLKIAFIDAGASDLDGLQASFAATSTAEHVAGAVWLGNERGLEERSRKPSTPPARNRLTHLATVFGVMLNWRATAALLSPASTHRTIASRPFGVRGAFLWLFIWSLRGKLKLRNLSFFGSDQMDNLLKAHI